MRYGSVCSGVEAATLAWMPLGWECKFVSEVEPFPCAVLQERFGATAPINPLDPDDVIITDEQWSCIEQLKKDGRDWTKLCDNADLVSRYKDKKMREAWLKELKTLNKKGDLPNEGDFTKIGKKYAGKIDLLVGGTPCQDLSVAGKRAGFDGERSSLALDFVRLAYESKCKWFVWENVPGVFSSNGGRDFATLLSLFTGAEIGVPRDGWSSAGFVCNARRDRYGVAWRTLDGQFTRASGFPFAVPQRRRRVFLVGYFGNWSRAAEVLLEPGRVCWNTPARFKARERIAGIAGANSAMADGTLQCNNGNNRKVFWNGNDCAETLTCSSDRQLRPDKKRLQCVIERNEVAATLTAAYGDKMGIENQHVDSGCPNFIISCNSKKMGLDISDDLCGTLNATDYKEPQVVYYDNQTRARNPLPTGDVACTMQAAMGEGGNNVPLIQCYDARGNGSGSVSPTATGDHLNRVTDFTPVVYECYAIDSVSSNSMKSANPHSGFHKEEIAKTLDTTDPGPTKNQGGNVIIEAVAVAENIIGRADHNGGNGIGAQEELAYTQNASGVMGVATASGLLGVDVYNQQITGDVAGTLTSASGEPNTSGPKVMACNSTVRRLLPVECERLMGFPDNWTRISWKGKPADECPDSPRYKACGNSMCVNVMRWIGEQIQKVEDKYNGI